MRSVLILGGRAPVALDHARRFAQQGWRVHVADSVSCNLSAYSRSVSGAARLPSPRYAGRQFVKELCRYISDQGIDLLVPTCEEVFFIARYRHLLPAQLCVAADDFDKLRQLHSKLTFIELAEDCGAVVPTTHRVRTLDEARSLFADKPIVLKPEFSRFGVHVRIYPNGIPHDAPPLAQLGNWVAQKYCSGDELCSYSIARAGKILTHIVYRPTYRLGRSASFYFAPVAAPATHRFVERFAAKVEFTGQLSFDWIRGGDGRCSVLECNPRATSGLHLFDYAAPLPEMLAGTDCRPYDQPTPRPRMLAALMLTTGLYASFRSNQLARWRSDYLAASDVIAASDDKRPIAGSLIDLISYARSAFSERCSMREAATRDIEWDGGQIHIEP
jgi:hypothetical protein